MTTRDIHEIIEDLKFVLNKTIDEINGEKEEKSALINTFIDEIEYYQKLLGKPEKTHKIREFYFKQDEEPPILVKLSCPKTMQEIQELDLDFLIENTKSVQENTNARERYLLKTILKFKKNIKEFDERIAQLEKKVKMTTQQN